MSPQMHHHPPKGCPECEYDRLRNWALSHNLIGSSTGPYETVDRIIRLVEKMDTTIKGKQARIEQLWDELSMIKSAGADVVREAPVPVGQLPEEPQ